MASYLWHLHKPLKSFLKIPTHSERHRPAPGMAEGENKNKKRCFNSASRGGSGLGTTNGDQPFSAHAGEPQQQGRKETGGAGPRSIILESSGWAAGDTVVAPHPLIDDGVLTCWVSAEGSSWGRSLSPGHCSFACSALTLVLQQKAVFTSTAPIWPSAINLCASHIVW